MASKRVTVRSRETASGDRSLYLDFYPPIRDPQTMKMVRRRSLGIIIYAKPTTAAQIRHNKEMTEKANIIRDNHYRMIVNDEFDFLDNARYKADALEFFYSIAKVKGDKWIMTYYHFDMFTQGKCIFSDINIELCNKFKDYLLSANQLKNRHLKLSHNSAVAYYNTFKALLKRAYRERYLKENINDFLDNVKTQRTKIEFLTLEECKMLADTPCRYPVLKSASLFSIMTGLRISDILTLDWSHIYRTTGGGVTIRKRLEKSRTDVTLPISEEALALCGEQKASGKIFAGLQKCWTHQPLKNWVKEAGITKHITYHCFRHTYATLQVSAGISIYTVSKMLGHKNVTTTQIYADLVDAAKEEAANVITLK